MHWSSPALSSSGISLSTINPSPNTCDFVIKKRRNDEQWKWTILLRMNDCYLNGILIQWLYCMLHLRCYNSIILFSLYFALFWTVMSKEKARIRKHESFHLKIIRESRISDLQRVFQLCLNVYHNQILYLNLPVLPYPWRPILGTFEEARSLNTTNRNTTARESKNTHHRHVLTNAIYGAGSNITNRGIVWIKPSQTKAIPHGKKQTPGTQQRNWSSCHIQI